MAELTTKELDALTDQLNYERMMACKYTAAKSAVQGQDLGAAFDRCAQQHRDNYNSLLNFLK